MPQNKISVSDRHYRGEAKSEFVLKMKVDLGDKWIEASVKLDDFWHSQR